MQPEWTKVDSSAMTHVRHDGQDLYVRYNSGREYVHRGVSPERYGELLAAQSKGSFLNTHIARRHPGVSTEGKPV